MYKFLLLVVGIFVFNIRAVSCMENQCHYWGEAYERLLLQKVGAKLPELVTYPFFQYPNEGYPLIYDRISSKHVLVFGYGSLMNKESAARSVKYETLRSMQPAIAFGVKRLFNYRMADASHWGAKFHRKEKAMLNLAQTLNIGSMANGVAFEVDAEDLKKLVAREAGYDLVPILVASWKDVLQQNKDISIQVAYTFVAVNELRNHIAYTSTEFYPVLGYLHAVQEAALTYGNEFANFWNETTYLANGTTKIKGWDGVTFMGILCTQKP